MSEPVRKIDKCRVCSTALQSVLDLGDQVYTGIFPASAEVEVPTGPLELAFCGGCGLVQIHHVFDPTVMYGDDYGYRSGLNGSMVRHLRGKVARLEVAADLAPGDWVLDIGSNDGTTLRSYSRPSLNRIGIDPTAAKFRQYYDNEAHVVADFFSADNYFSVATDKAKLVTSIAMFYDLEDPVSFAAQVGSVLRPDGIWHFEQSYLPTMLNRNSFDTICHEHVSYYSLYAIEQILGRAGLRVLDLRFNDINGGSFAITASHAASPLPANEPVLDWIREQEAQAGIHTAAPLLAFAERTQTYAASIRSLLEKLADAGRSVIGYGASTKGNVVLQYAGIGPRHIQAIAEVNPDKFGCVTPGTHIPIISDSEARAMNPDYYFVLPWHFKTDILAREGDYLAQGGRFIFPLPEPEIV
jgi:hypothetical protein